MSDKPSDSRDSGEPPVDPKAPPNLRLGLRDKPEVKALLAELNRDLKPGEDPLFYELPEAPPDDPAACAPNEARAYVGPTAPPMAHHKTLEMDRVKVAPRVDPRRAVTQRSLAKGGGASPWAAAETPVDKAELPSAMGPEAGREEAPPLSRPTNVGPKSGAANKRTAMMGALALGAVAAAIGIAAAVGGPHGAESASASATAIPSTTATAAVSARAIPRATATAPSVQPSPSAAPAASTAPAPGAPRMPRGKPPKDEDPYDAAPGPPVTAAPAATPPSPAVPNEPKALQPEIKF
jgi:hypothetical protein